MLSFVSTQSLPHIDVKIFGSLVPPGHDGAADTHLIGFIFSIISHLFRLGKRVAQKGGAAGSAGRFCENGFAGFPSPKCRRKGATGCFLCMFVRKKRAIFVVIAEKKNQSKKGLTFLQRQEYTEKQKREYADEGTGRDCWYPVAAPKGRNSQAKEPVLDGTPESHSIGTEEAIPFRRENLSGYITEVYAKNVHLRFLSKF